MLFIKYSKAARILALTLEIFSLLCVMFSALSAFAQSPDTLRIPFNRSEITQSNIILRQDALYRWTVRGRAQVGVSGQSPIIVDARFATSNLGLPQLPEQPTRLPLDENTPVQPLCTSLQETSPASSPCNIYFGTNARRGASNLALDPAFRLADAAQMKQYAFRPDDDTFRASSIYQAIVRGANDFVKALFVEGFGFGNNRSYADNPADTALVLTIERLSPELLLTAEPNFNITGRLPVRVLNDISPASTFRDTTIDFGSVQVNTPPVQVRRIVLRNRGAEPLRILRIEAPMLNPVFTVASSAGALENPTLLGAMSDSITLSFTFFARDARQYTQEIRIITNDPANPTFTVRLQGSGASGTLSPVLPMNFGNVYVGTTAPVQTREFSRTNFVDAFAIDSVQLPAPSSGFTVIGLAPQSYQVGTNPRFSPSGTFSPRTIGDFADSAVLRGNNLVDYKILLTGRGVRADFALLRQGTPLVERVLDFGAHVSGASTTQTFTIQNTGNLPLNIARNLAPSPNGRPSDVGEFEIVSAPTTLGEMTGTTQTFVLRYTANPQNPEGRKEVFFDVNINDGNNGAALTPQRFRLIAQRLPNVITPSRTDIRFDSVYVGTQVRDTVLLANTSARFAGTILRQTPPNAPFSADTVRSPRALLPANSALVNLGFSPMQEGPQEGTFTFTNRVDSTGAQETSRVGVRGVGVRQQFTLIRLTSDTSANTNTTINTVSTLVNGKTRTYTANIGCVRVGERRDIGCFFRNDGNISFRASDRFVRLEPAQTRDFTVVNPFQISRSLLPTEQDGSLRIRFTPTVRGPQEIQYTLRSDIRQNIGGRIRIPTAPDSTDDITIIIRGEGITPSIEAPQSVDFGEITFDAAGVGCNSRTQAIPFTNPATPACGTFTRLSNPRIASASATPFSIRSGSTDLIVRTGSSVGTIQVEFKPTRQGEFQDELIVNTDAPPPRDVLRIRLTGRSIPLPNVVMRIATNHTARPGSPTLVTVPVLVEASTIGTLSANTGALRLTNRVAFQLQYNRTLLEFERANTNGTASEGGRVEVTKRDTANREQQTLFVSIEAARSDNFRPLETLVNLVFTPYLGNAPATELSLASVRFGDSTCPKINIGSNDIKSGQFQLDGVCDLVWKATLLTQKPPAMADISPNPIIGGQGKIRFLVNEAATITITMRDALGVHSARTLVQERSFDAGLYEETLPLENVPTGTYFCEMRAVSAHTQGVYREVKKFVVVR